MTVIITGSDGFLGGKIIREILQKTELDILGLTISMDRPMKMLARENIWMSERIRFMANEEFMNKDTSIDNIYGAIHLAFSRRTQPAKDIASSIDFAATVFHRLVELNVNRVINLSSQGVYGNTEEIRTESTPPAPETQYTMAKYATEVIFNDVMRDIPHHTNLRLDPVAQSQNVLKGLCKSAKEGIIKLKGGDQVFSFIDAEDAAAAIVNMLLADGEWDGVYNVGWNRRRYTLVELAKLVAEAAEKKGYNRPEIVVDNVEIALWAGMDSSKFYEKTRWTGKINLSETIENMISKE